MGFIYADVIEDACVRSALLVLLPSLLVFFLRDYTWVLRCDYLDSTILIVIVFAVLPLPRQGELLLDPSYPKTYFKPSDLTFPSFKDICLTVTIGENKRMSRTQTVPRHEVPSNAYLPRDRASFISCGEHDKTWEELLPH